MTIIKLSAMLIAVEKLSVNTPDENEVARLLKQDATTHNIAELNKIYKRIS